MGVSVSVIIPVYNTEKYLQTTIDSIINQSLKDLEIILVNDGSTDNSLDLLKKYVIKDKRITLINQKNGGLSNARNNGLRQAHGKYIYFIDSDDSLELDALEYLFDESEKNNLDVLYFDAKSVYENGDLENTKSSYKTYYDRPGKYQGVYKGVELFAQMLNDGTYRPSACIQFIKKSFLDSTGVWFPEGVIHEDNYFTAALIVKADRVSHRNKKFYRRLVRNSSIMTRRESFSNVLGYFTCMRELACYAVQNNIDDIGKNALSHFLNNVNQNLSRIFYKLSPSEYENYLQLNPIDQALIYYFWKKNHAIMIDEVISIINSFDNKAENLTPAKKTNITVIVPAFNNYDYLKQCLDSILCQTLNDFEVIVINDGSTDDSESLLKYYSKKDARVKIINQPNMGVALARNRAIDIAKGEYVCFMDADDFYPDDTVLKILYDKAKLSGAMICGGSFSNFKDGEVTTNFIGKNDKYTFLTEGSIKYADYQFDYGYHRFIYNREFLKSNDIKFPYYKRFQDPPFLVKAMICANWFYAIPKVVYRYRLHNQKKPDEWPPDKLKDMFRGCRDDLTMSLDHKLANLHALTVERIEGNYTYPTCMNRLEAGDEELMSLLIEINSKIDINLLKSSGFITDHEHNYYLIKQLRNLPLELMQEKKELNDIKFGYSFRIGRLITFIPRKIRGGKKCLRQHGLMYTLRRTLWHLGMIKN